jgi:hypothetical protein
MNVLFFHIPKTAGTFFANQLKYALGLKLYRYFTESKIYETLDCKEMPEDILQSLRDVRYIKNSQYDPCINIDNLTALDNIVLYAHEFDDSVLSLFDCKKWLKVTILRDPVERMFSSYAQRQRNDALDNMTNIHTDQYQFYFIYHSLCKDELKLDLNEETAPIILNKAIEALKQFDLILYQSKLNQQFEEYFKTPPSNLNNKSNDNITKKDVVLHIEYNAIKYISQYIEYDYKLLRAFSCNV